TGLIEFLTIFRIAILLSRCEIYDARRKNSLPPRGRRFPPRHESPPHPTGVDEGHSSRDRQDHQPVVPLADRAWQASAYDAVLAHSAGALFQGASRLSGR